MLPGKFSLKKMQHFGKRNKSLLYFLCYIISLLCICIGYERCFINKVYYYYISINQVLWELRHNHKKLNCGLVPISRCFYGSKDTVCQWKFSRQNFATCFLVILRSKHINISLHISITSWSIVLYCMLNQIFDCFFKFQMKLANMWGLCCFVWLIFSNIASLLDLNK